MSSRQQPERLTALLHKVRRGDHAAGDDLYRLVFDDLRRMANGFLSGERKELPEASEISGRLEVAEEHEAGQATAS